MFNKDFYPTPKSVADQMLFGLDLKGMTVLEPSAGSGNLIDILHEFGAYVVACENNKELATIAASKSDEFLKEDFYEVTSGDISHVDCIIMNPPFSADEKHILHAWEISPGGCQIVSLCNWNTLDKRNSMYRKSLRAIMNEHGNHEYLGKVFTTAERRTDVEVGLVRLWKPDEGGDEFEGYFDLEEELPEGNGEEGIMSYNSIREIVNRYVGAVKMFDEVMKYNNMINDLIEPINQGSHKYEFGCHRSGDTFIHEISRDQFKKKLQRSAWEGVFKKLKMEKYVTSSVMEDINRFVEKQQNVPFTMKNVYKMLEVIVGTHGQRMERVIVQAFDTITKYHHENRFYREGWKTNDQYRVGRKFILPGVVSFGFHGYMDTNWRTNGNVMDDIHKALCYVTGTNFDETEDFYQFIRNADENGDSQHREFGELYDWGFFKIRGYKKGTLHCTFKDEKVWDEFNRVACKAKGFHLAEKFTSDFRRKSTNVETHGRASHVTKKQEDES